ncbi:membrane protein insertase YidC [Neokomagataea anthophila]|uniref:Membrane protein insertase YidC n=1 Tax=Neokomagataea anthophila TaxID=2826925 RepID=A0ABS5E5D0_9PROT|nr:membrane protein insertase YidC [Neokomagataea anthophila]MBR0558743.1 membrane protein insertase YidC [Neokomagataea anthophila]
MDIKRIIAATILSGLILIGFDYFMPKPAPATHAPAQVAATAPVSSQSSLASTDTAQNAAPAVAARRLTVRSPDVQGSITLKGALLDDLVLTKYRETLAKDSPLVRLLSAPGSSAPSYVVIGWENAPGSNAAVPGLNTVWQSNDDALDPTHPVTMHWDNGQGQVFIIRLSIDSHYVIAVQQTVENHGTTPVSLIPYQRVQRDYEAQGGSWTEHEGPVSVMDGRLNDESYKNLRDAATHPDHTYWAKNGTGGWVGLSDKYWLTAVLAESTAPVSASFGFVPGLPGTAGSYRVGFTAQSAQTIMPNASITLSSHIFAGAKVVDLLQSYSRDLHVPDLDKAIDFGWFSFLTRPILTLLHWLYVHLGNFGLALMALTLIVKIILFPLAAKASASSGRMRLLAPKIQEIRERHKDDPMAANQKVMALYKEEGVSPASGCLPMLIQAPIFFCLYKMLYISIDERHAPFFGWIHDLSIPDPTNIFNLFGLLPFDPTAYISMLHVSVWGTALGITFWLLQRQTTVTMDPAQARIMQFMPLVYVFFMSSFPASLLVYYTWNNLLTFAQQAFIQSRTKLPVPVTTAKKGR